MSLKDVQVKQFPPLEAIYFREWDASHIPEIFEELYIRRIYNPFLLGKKDMIIVDAGQNIGLFSYFAKDFAKRIIGLEPSAMHRDTCAHMLEFNKITNVEIYPYALSNKKETRDFYMYPNSTAYSLTKLAGEYPTEKVEAITLDDMFKLCKIEGKVDLFKCDIEGEEDRVFTSDSFINNTDRFPLIIGEWHNFSSMNQVAFCNHFRDLGYEFNWIFQKEGAVFTAVKV